MLQFRRRRTHILTCLLQHDHTLFTRERVIKEVSEAIGTGLAIQYTTTLRKPLNPLAPTSAYGLVHLASGTVLTGETAPTIVSAAMWLRRVPPLFDWTLPQEAFKRRQDIAVQVHMKEVYSFQEIAHLVKRGRKITFTYPLRVEVMAVAPHPDRNTLQVRFALLVGEYAIAEFTSGYDTIESLQDAFDRADHQEVFELAGEKNESEVAGLSKTHFSCIIYPGILNTQAYTHLQYSPASFPHTLAAQFFACPRRSTRSF